MNIIEICNFFCDFFRVTAIFVDKSLWLSKISMYNGGHPLTPGLAHSPHAQGYAVAAMVNLHHPHTDVLVEMNRLVGIADEMV